jgi:hypothetical protein
VAYIARVTYKHHAFFLFITAFFLFIPEFFYAVSFIYYCSTTLQDTFRELVQKFRLAGKILNNQ